ncbi:hypothetical protein M9Y10_034982 [Tritrichomonas musculus]|uniref:Small GTP-binding protein n=1 Tax=Tritrichomonas musculus TaxID=1915356 RepID=A0ABR2KHH3_9EUKA
MNQIELKCVLIGNTNVGKTCIVHMATTGVFEETSTTLGASYSAKTEMFNEHLFRLQIWDTAGQEKYRGMTPMYYHNAHIAIIVYSIANSESFEAVDSWFKSLRNNADSDIIIFLVGNKVDLESERTVSTEEGEKKAKQFGAEFCEVSAKTGFGIADLFSLMPMLYLEKKPNPNDNESNNVEITETPKEKTNKQCC